MNNIYKRCPTCGRTYEGLEKYCTKCGIVLVAEENKCSEMKTSLCSSVRFQEDDIYCCYCGALTTYAKKREDERQKWGNFNKNEA